jgi:ketosteroid isomerase-like protein
VGTALALLLALGSTGCSPTGSDAAAPEAVVDAELEQAVITAHQSLMRAYEEQSIDQFVLLLSRSPRLVIFHPRSTHRFDGLDQVRANLGLMFERLDQATWTEAHPQVVVHGETAWVTAHVLVESPSIDTPLMGRSTEIWILEEGAWKLIHGHWSDTPGVYMPDLASS